MTSETEGRQLSNKPMAVYMRAYRKNLKLKQAQREAIEAEHASGAENGAGVDHPSTDAGSSLPDAATQAGNNG